MSRGPDPEFYVGYLDPAPPRLGKFLKRFVGFSVGLSVVLAALVGAGQEPLPEAYFEFGTTRSAEGYLVADPYPSLLVPRGPVTSRYLLVAPGKAGADDLVEGLAGSWVRLDGTLVYRNGQTLVEVVPGTAAALEADSPPPLPAIEDLGMTYVEGEIVGSKCYLGVMNPGSGPAHRACARLCIQGGIPPLLQVRRDDGNTEGLVLVSSDGGPVGDELLPLVAEPVGVTGHLVRIGSSTFLQADAIDFRRLE